MISWSKLKHSPSKLLRKLSAYDNRYYLVKYAVALILAIVYTLFMGHDTILDERSVKARRAYLLEEQERLEPLFATDSARLERIKAQGAEVEHIAREKYLMKAPGEEIYIVSPNQQTTP